jgi:O-antigen ligase
MQILVPLVVALAPLLITPNLLYYFDITPKIAVILIGAAIALLLFRENARNMAALLNSRAGRWFALLLCAYWILFTASTVASTHPALSLNGSNWRRLGLVGESALLIFVLLAAAWLAQDRRNVRMLLRSVSASGAVGAVYGIAQYFGFDPFLPARAYQAGEGPFTIVRPPGTLGHAVYFAGWLVFVVFCSLTLAQMEERAWSKRFVWSIASIAAIAIVLSGTRAALLGLAGGVVALLISRTFRASVGLLVFSAAIVACIALLMSTPAGLKLRARLHWSLDDARGGARLLLWRDTLRMASTHPVLGFGPETFATEFPRFASIDLARAYPDFYHESPHNVFLDAAAGQGLLSALLLAGLCGLALYAAGRSRILAAGLVAVLVSQQFAVLIAPTALSLYILMSLCIISSTNSVAAPPSRGRPPGGLLQLVTIPIAAMFVVCAVRLLIADRALAIVQHRIAAEDPGGAAAAYQTVQRWQPSGTGSDLEYSRQMAALANRTPVFRTRLEAWQQAMQAAARAAQTAEDRQNAWYNLATLLAGQNDSQGVERSLRNAIQWAPNWFKPHWTLAQVLELTNRHEEALAEASYAVRLNGDKDPEVIETWIKLSGKGLE